MPGKISGATSWITVRLLMDSGRAVKVAHTPRTAANTYVKLKDKHPTDYYKWIGAYSHVRPLS
jgi:hypothetical protein